MLNYLRKIVSTILKKEIKVRTLILQKIITRVSLIYLPNNIRFKYLTNINLNFQKHLKKPNLNYTKPVLDKINLILCVTQNNITINSLHFHQLFILAFSIHLKYYNFINFVLFKNISKIKYIQGPA